VSRAVVIYCDASVPNHLPPAECVKVGWGAVIIAGNDVHEASGAYRWDGSNSTKAEIEAARESLRFVVERGLALAGDTVFLASDCEAVPAYLNTTPRRPRGSLMRVSGQIRALALRHSLELVVVHVKGHNGGPNGCRFDEDPHARYNSRADRLAKEASR
jgi:ribonuclease HI